ncbi:MAG: xanthine dehydrogenase family protein subunit M, partial [bacterium]|nr:xanthine dehydrogenase family protein subunit M [bacterium]
TDNGDHYRVGALTTWRDLVQEPLPSYFDALKQAAIRVGGVQIQNRATVVGNICNASPAADGVPALLCLDAQVELSSQSEKRNMPLHEFLLGNRSTAIRADELVSALVIPKLADSAFGGFEKLGTRRYLVISIVMVAMILSIDENERIDDVRIAVGACSAVAQRMTGLEELLQGRKCGTDLAQLITMGQFELLTPIGDVRADASYRRQTALEVTRRLLTTLSQSAR